MADQIGEIVKSGLKPDVVAITGDIADKGRKEDYEEARRWIDDKLFPALGKGFPKKHLLLVPGNHDVDRGAVRIAAKGVQRELLDGESQDAIAELLGDPEERSVLLKRHDAYLQLAKDYGRPSTVPWWSATLTLRRQRVHFAGLCSSWMSSVSGRSVSCLKTLARPNGR